MTKTSDNDEGKSGIDDRSLAIEERRLLLEERKLEADIELRKLELSIKGQGGGWLSNFTPLTTTLLAGVLTLAGSVVGTLLQGRQTLELEETKFHSTRNLEREKFDSSKEIDLRKQQHELILKMISVGDEKQARSNIRFLAESGLIADQDLAKRLLAAPSVGVLPSANAIAPRPRLIVLTIGVSDYGDKARDLRLKFAHRDAQDVARALLQSPEGSFYTEVKIWHLSDHTADKPGIFDALVGIQRLTLGGDLAVVMFSGHSAIVDGEAYLLPYGVDNSTPTTLARSAIRVAEFRDQISRVAGRVLLLLDACHSAQLVSGERSADALRALLDANNVSVLTSSVGDQLSLEDDKWQHGAFTKAFLDALSGSADLDSDGMISVIELVTYMSEHLSQLTDGRQQLGINLRFQANIFGYNRSAAVPRVPTFAK